MVDRRPLSDKVHDWLAQEGYPFELAVGRTLREAGWRVAHARFFRDPITAKARELDIVAAKVGKLPEDGPWFGVGFAIECKSSKSKPWVVFSAPKSPGDGAFPSLQLVGSAAGTALALFAKESSGRSVKVLNAERRYGHGVVQATFAKRTRQAPMSPYSAIRSSIAAATAMSLSNERMFVGLGRPFIQFLFPAIVFDGVLFEMYLDQEGNELLEETNRARVLAHRIDKPDHHCVVNIVTRQAVPQLLADAIDDLELIEEVLRPFSEELAAAVRGEATVAKTVVAPVR